MGDYAAQAVVNTMLSRAFPQDPIVGEESSAAIREASSKDILDRIVELANEALTADLGLGDDPTWGIGPGENRTPTELLDAIDRGNHDGGPTGRTWHGSVLAAPRLNTFGLIGQGCGLLIPLMAPRVS